MKRGQWWPIAITGILATTVGANIWMITIANADPSFAIEKDYYRKALAWDTTLAQAERNAKLGWRLTATMAPTADGGTVIAARLTDSLGVALTGATMRVTALPIARATEAHEMLVAPAGRGEYSARLGPTRGGQWELRFDATIGTERFTQLSRLDVASRP